MGLLLAAEERIAKRFDQRRLHWFIQALLVHMCGIRIVEIDTGGSAVHDGQVKNHVHNASEVEGFAVCVAWNTAGAVHIMHKCIVLNFLVVCHKREDHLAQRLLTVAYQEGAGLISHGLQRSARILRGKYAIDKPQFWVAQQSSGIIGKEMWWYDDPFPL